MAELHGPAGERLQRVPPQASGKRIAARRWAAYRPDGTVLRTLDGREQRYLSAVSACFALGWALEAETMASIATETPSRTA